ncbi:hypothetical protein FDUTEX481_09368 [Tolypothrix sp. PCC 7601]|nr:hypothetical protein FDUTEX481_09368 [Tolypothrix sp. PCC 7601]
MRNKITDMTGYKFKIINDNHYIIGTNFISWHGDNEWQMRLKPYFIWAFWRRSHLLTGVIHIILKTNHILSTERVCLFYLCNKAPLVWILHSRLLEFRLLLRNDKNIFLILS